MIFRAIKVKATVSRSDRSITFCSTLFILSFSLSFIFSNSNDFASNTLFHRDSRMFVSFDRDERIELIRTKSINLSCFNAFFFFFFYSVHAIFYNKQRRSDIRLDLYRGKIAGSFNL